MGSFQPNRTLWYIRLHVQICKIRAKQLLKLTSTAGWSFRHLSTPEACWNVSQAYASFAYAWNASKARTALEGVSRIPRPRPGCRYRLLILSRGTQKTRTPG